MDTSIVLAKLIGSLYLVIGIGILVTPKHYNKMIDDFTHNAALLYLGGVLAFCVGLLLVQFHNVWNSSWEVIITLLGWAALIKGIILLIAPTDLQSHMKWWKAHLSYCGMFAIVIGGVLSYFGFLG